MSEIPAELAALREAGVDLDAVAKNIDINAIAARIDIGTLSAIKVRARRSNHGLFA